MWQKIIIVGNLGGDPELRYTPSAEAVTTISVATNRNWTTADGQPGEEVVWFRVSVWGKQAEACNQYLKKGSQVLVEGRLTPDKATGGPRIWTNNEGVPQASYEMRALTVQFLSRKGEDLPEEGPSTPDSKPDSIAEDEIPF